MALLLSGWMLYALWIVLGFMALDFLVSLYRSLRASDFSPELVLGYLKDMLYYVLPLLLLADISLLDTTGWLVSVLYYVGALGVVLKYLSSLKGKL
ncbi:conserved hypothetical protein [Paenibacillus curdlanolyticus YK9]|uniref:Uncharacterized protein n=1 Tax=Paenibacillus curdlanolyticus YK9 TaxID=717606 RepID=E0I4I0_9BACL|nr:hypothetical protein [Paenibacillus curdlanolyticus]EFM12511.1 conserved hypothetical protein [Paenibacillus curdlanolyticus YK9]